MSSTGRRPRRSPAVWSCLAAHAAVWRTRRDSQGGGLRASSLGVFELQPAGDHPLLGDTSVPMRAPHSRLNGLGSRNDLRAAGYQILTRSGEVGVDAFVKPGPAIDLFFQGTLNMTRIVSRASMRRLPLLGRRTAAHPLPPSGFFDFRPRYISRRLPGAARAGRDHGLMTDYHQASPAPRKSAGWRLPGGANLQGMAGSCGRGRRARPASGARGDLGP